MKRLLIALLFVLMTVAGAQAADVQISSGIPTVQAIRHFYVTGSSDISASLTIPTQGVKVMELVSIELHLSAAGGANDLTVTHDSVRGAEYDTVWLTQDMTTATDVLVQYNPGEAIFPAGSALDFAWTNGSGRTYGLAVTYKLR